ncbi:MAG: carboxyltransferase domain-containing protein [Aeromicrobium sp.]
MTPRLDIREYGDSGLLVDVAHDDHESRWATAQGIRAVLEDLRPPGLVDIVATFDSVFLAFDPLVTDHAALGLVVETIGPEVVSTVAVASPRVFRVPTLYGGDAGPDLDEVASDLGMTAQELVDRHTSTTWRIRFRASPVGAPFMDGPTWPRPIPRLSEPRTRVSPGSVALSGQQCVIYPVASPGGWRLIGVTPSILVDPSGDVPVVHVPGDSLRFVSVGPAEFARLSEQPEELMVDTSA